MVNVVNGSLGGSSLLRGAQRSFDVRNESDVIALLKTIHQNPIEPDVKNELRDLIFNYRQSMADSDAAKLSEAFAQLGISILSTLQTSKTAPVAQNKGGSSKQIGSGRPQPRFAQVTLAPQKITESPVVPVQKMETQQVPVVKRATVPPPPPTIEPSTVAPVLGTNYADRIKEIKRIVNEKIGNPVNLIDAHNEIGREYMNALLDAMKKTSGVQGGEGIVTAMERLEKAFAQVQSVIFSTSGTSVPVQEVPKNEVEQVQAPVKEAVVPAMPPAQEPVVPPVEARRTIPVKNVEEAVASTISSPVKMASVRQNLQSGLVENKTVIPALARTPTPSPSTPTPVAPQAPLPKYTSEEPEGIHSVAKEKLLQDLLREDRLHESQAKKQEEAARVATMDPIQTPEVTAGLSQLLSEWGLFKSSGIFGTGPSGKEHPLYQKISGLTMAAVIAGRFEGATPHIKQSITDYMNGWRYEEGVIHEHAETFEHYLRRVIRHILDKQKRK